jgi:apolipoprotein D and lipocalin family protein
MCRTAFLTLLVAIGSLSLGCGSEPPLDVASNVDLTRFQGKWYEIARLPRTTQTDCYGTTAFYTGAANGTLNFVNQCNVGSAGGPLTTVSMVASVPDTTVPAKLTLDVGGFTGDYWILEVGQDYEYAVVGHPSRAYLWILSRTPTLDSTTMQGVLGRAQGNHFDTSRLLYTPQPPGAERVAMDAPEGTVPPAVHTGCSVSRASTDEGIVGYFGVIALMAALGVRRMRRES